jgi:hypothetical protein
VFRPQSGITRQPRFSNRVGGVNVFLGSPFLVPSPDWGSGVLPKWGCSVVWGAAEPPYHSLVGRATKIPDRQRAGLWLRLGQYPLFVASPRPRRRWACFRPSIQCPVRCNQSFRFYIQYPTKKFLRRWFDYSGAELHTFCHSLSASVPNIQWHVNTTTRGNICCSGWPYVAKRSYTHALNSGTTIRCPLSPHNV